MPSAVATASGTADGSVTAASSKTQTPSGNSSREFAATSSASRVLPTPPTPVNVTSRRGLNRAAILGDLGLSCDKLVSGGRRFPRVAFDVAQRREIGREAFGACTWKHP